MSVTTCRAGKTPTQVSMLYGTRPKQKGELKMFEKFKEKCKALSQNGAVVVTFVCILLALTVVLSVTIATNRAKKEYASESTTVAGNQQTTESATNSGNIVEDTVNTPTHNDTESLPVSGEVEEFKLALPANGVIAKGHDATIQVWSETMGDYRVHLGIDIQTAENAPVYAAADGVISKVWDDALMGRCVAISHDGEVFTFYKNLDSTLASGIAQGKEVKAGQEIGYVGNTAIAELADEPHLHIEMTVNGLAVDPRDYLSDEAKASLQNNTFEEEATEKTSGK